MKSRQKGSHPLSVSDNPANRYDPALGSRPSPYTSDAVLDALCRAGLGSIPQSCITPEQLAAALRGEKPRTTSSQRRLFSFDRRNPDRPDGRTGKTKRFKQYIRDPRP